MIDSTYHWTQHPRAIFLVVTGLAFLLRLIHIWQMSDPLVNPTFWQPVTDAGVHHRWAQQILAGTWPPPEPFFRAPLYPYFLAGLYSVFGSANPLGVQLVHGLISALGAGLAALCSLKLWDWRAAWGSGLLMATLWSSIYFAGELLGVTISVTLNLLLLYLVLGAKTKGQMLVCGLVLGLSAITRPTVLVITPALLWYFWSRGRLQFGGLNSGGLWLAVGVALIIAPVTWRNLHQGGEPVMIAASGGVNFYIGNNEYADGRVAFLPGAPLDWQGEMSDVIALASEEAGQPLSAQDSNRYFWHQGFKFWRDHPQQAMRLLTRKTWLLVAAGERSNNKNLAFWRARSPLLRWPVWPGWAIVLGLAVLGFFRHDFKVRERRLLWGVIGLYALALLLFFVNARFRLPVMAWLVVPAGGGIATIFAFLKSRSLANAPRFAVPVALLVCGFSYVPDALTYQPNPANDFESWRMLGNSYASLGHEPQALQTWATALAIDERDPQSAHRWTLPQIYQAMVQIHQRAGRNDLALRVQRRWTARLPASSHARLGLAYMLLQAEQVNAAIKELEIVVLQSPDNVEAQLGLGWAHYQNGNFAVALIRFEEAAESPAGANAEYGVGLTLLALTRYDIAEAKLKDVVAKSPVFWQAYENLALLYQATDRPIEERRCWVKVLDSRPQHNLARQRIAVLP